MDNIKIIDVTLVNKPFEVVISPTMPGPTGPKGDNSNIIVKMAGENLSGNRFITIIDNNSAVYADKFVLYRVIGMTLDAALEGSEVRIQIAGEVEELSWNLTPMRPIYLDENGLFTQIIPTEGYMWEVGIATTTTKMFIDIKPPIKLL